MLVRLVFSFTKLHPGTVLGIFIWVGQSKAKQILGRPTEVVYVGIMGMTRAIWVGQVRVWVGYGLPGLIARTASDNPRHYFPFIFTGPPTHGVGGRLVTVAGICRRLSSNRAQRRVTLSIRATPFRLRQTEL